MDREEKQRNYALAEDLLSEQNFVPAVIAGAIAMLLAAGIYGLTTLASGGFSYSFMAIGIGIAIGFTMQYLGKGIATRFAVVASIYAVLGCILGNLFAAVLYVAKVNQASPLDVLANVPLSELSDWVFADLQFVDLIFWMAAIGGAAYFVKRRLSREEALALHVYEMRH